MAERTLVDTNVLVYLFDASEPEKKETAREVMDDVARRGTLAVSAQVLSEFYVSVTKKLSPPLTPRDAALAVDSLLSLPFVAVDPTTVVAAVSRSQADRIAYWDALLVETARSGDCSEILSEDFQDGREYGGVRIRNPFRGVERA